MQIWRFPDSPNVAVFTTREVLEGTSPIVFAAHDPEDGAWQFLGANGAPSDMADARVVGLGTIVESEPLVAELWDLPQGWIAYRTEDGTGWHREQPA